ncbi:MAG: hypothetical protein KatS3mg102_2460 [Planctomycetota bacterium]|nr:MAG: hypothetical protein KatS3mg102_2460 [Planctomycetota bacterium]
MRSSPAAGVLGRAAARWGVLAAGLARRLGRLALRQLVRAARSRRGRECASLALFVLAAAALSLHAREAVRAERRYRVSKASLAATAPPPGLTRAAIDELAYLPFPGRSFSLYDPLAVPAIAATFERLPWVRQVRAIEVAFPSRLRFDLVVRRPVAGLAHGGEEYLIDADGMVLPRHCYAPAEPRALRLPVIVGADIGRRRVREGELLEHVPVRHGIAVALALRAERFDHLWSLPVTIDVSNVDGRVDPRRSEIVVTAGSTRIEWGRSPASERLHIPVAEKIERLRGLLDREPNLARLALVRLQFDELEVQPRQPAAEIQ